MGRYLLIKNNIVSTIVKCDDTSLLSNEYTILDSQNYPGVGINHIYNSDTNTFKRPLSFICLTNYSSASFDDTDPNYKADEIMGIYTSASYDGDGNLETPESITSSSVSLEFVYSLNSVSEDALNIKGATINNISTVDNKINFDLFPDPSLHPQGSISIIFDKTKIISTDGLILSDNSPNSFEINYQSI